MKFTRKPRCWSTPFPSASPMRSIAHLGYPRYDPHGEPIPDRRGNVASRPERCLSQVDPQGRFEILRVVPLSKELLVYLKQVKMEIGTHGTVLAKAPLAGPVTVEIEKGDRIESVSLGRSISDQIFVALI
jgi:DtxR family Mn-dependent transcriptional regulator